MLYVTVDVVSPLLMDEIYKRKLINKIQEDVRIYRHHFSVQKEKLIFENTYLVWERNFKKKERFVHITQAGKLTFP